MLGTVIEGVSNAAIGKGMTLFGGSDQDKEDFKAWTKKVGVDHNFLRLMFENIATFKGFYPEYVYDLEMDDNSNLIPKIDKIYCVNFTKGRVGIRNVVGEVEKYWLHRHSFDNKRRRWRQELMSLMAFPGPEEASELVADGVTTVRNHTGDPFFDGDLEDLGKGRFMSFHFIPSISSDEYPMADFAKDATINAAIIDAYLPQFDVAGLENGLSVGHIVTIPLARPRKGDKAGQEKYESDKKKIRADIQETLQGVENTDNVMAVFVDPRSEQQPITIAEVPNNNNADTLNEKDERKERTLLTAFQVRHPALVGLPPRAGKGLNAQAGILHEAEGQWYTSFVLKRTEVAEDFFNNALIPLWEYEERDGDTTGLEVKFPMDQRFKREVPTEVILKTFTVEMVYNHFGIDQEYTEEHQQTLVRDLLTRSLGGNTADPTLLVALGILPEEAMPAPPEPPQPPAPVEDDEEPEEDQE